MVPFTVTVHPISWVWSFTECGPTSGCGLGVWFSFTGCDLPSLGVFSAFLSQQTEYDLLMEEQVSFVMSETVGGHGTEEMTGPSEAERVKMTLDEVSSQTYVPWYTLA